jgi:membrane-bound ClpP family serine protease
MDVLIILICIVAAVVLLLVELFLLPGISVAGFLAAAAFTFANYYAFTTLGMLGGFVTLGISVILCIGSLVWFMRSKTLDKISLKKSITSTVDRSAAAQVKVGDKGIAITRLALIGNADIDGNIVEVKSSDGFLNEKTPIVVTRIMDGIIMVDKA